MAFIKMVTRADGKQVAEVFIKGDELLKALKQQGLEPELIKLNERYCLTFTHSKMEEYD